MRHPGKYELLAYAESLTDDCSSISVRIAGHVARCPRCQAEVEGARTSLSVLRLSPYIDPSDDSTLRLLKAARAERRRFQQQAARSTARMSVHNTGAWTVLKGLGYAAGILVVSALCFGVALGSRSQVIATSSVLARQDAGKDQPSPEALRKTTAEIQALVAAVSSPSKNPPSALEIERWRAVSALNTDLEAARSALARNPGCERALRVMDSNLQRQAQALRALYAERSL
jgi:hypothetical protein